MKEHFCNEKFITGRNGYMKKYDFRKLFIKMMDVGLSGAKLSVLSGVSSASIHRLKEGKAIKLDSLLKICSVLKCELNDIMDVREK